MQLSERLNKLVGHDVFLNTTDGQWEDYTVVGTLEEVGEDYFVVKPLNHIAGFPIDSGQVFIALDKASPIIHTADCRQCRG